MSWEPNTGLALKDLYRMLFPTLLVVGVSEAGKYLSSKLIGNSDKVYDSETFRKYKYPFVKG